MLHDVGIKLVPVSSIGEPGSIKISEQLDTISRRESLPCVESSEPGRKRRRAARVDWKPTCQSQAAALAGE